jgi:hypothetical protein
MVQVPLMLTLFVMLAAALPNLIRGMTHPLVVMELVAPPAKLRIQKLLALTEAAAPRQDIVMLEERVSPPVPIVT